MVVPLDLRDAPLRSILGIIASNGDLNFVFDRDVKTDQRTSIMVRDMSLDDVLKVLLLTNQLERKVLNENSILIYPATQAKQREYQELVTRSFYLANADPKQTAAMIRALVKTRDLFVDEKLNLIIMRDTPDAVRMAEQLVATQDLGEPEVMLELEVLEVASSLAQELGLRFPEQVAFELPGPNGLVAPVVELSSRSLRAMVANPVLLLNLRKQDGNTNILANPRIRVKNREKAKVHIGERVPVITTTSTANVGVSSSVNYLETGLKLDVEPNIFLENEVSIKIELEQRLKDVTLLASQDPVAMFARLDTFTRMIEERCAPDADVDAAITAIDAAATAQALEPEASVSPAPRSQTSTVRSVVTALPVSVPPPDVSSRATCTGGCVELIAPLVGPGDGTGGNLADQVSYQFSVAAPGADMTDAVLTWPEGNGFVVRQVLHLDLADQDVAVEVDDVVAVHRDLQLAVVEADAGRQRVAKVALADRPGGVAGPDEPRRVPQEVALLHVGDVPRPHPVALVLRVEEIALQVLRQRRRRANAA